MSHTVSGSIRKAPFIKEGQNNNGNYTMFCFELSEFNKGTGGAEDSYANYDIALFAKTQGAIDFHTKAIAEGSFVVVSCDKLKIDKQQGGNGTEYIKLKMMNASLDNFSNPNAQAPQQNFAPQQQMAPQQNFAPQAQQPQQPQQQGGFAPQGQQQQRPAQQQQGGFAPAQQQARQHPQNQPMGVSQQGQQQQAAPQPANNFDSFDDDIPFS